jgi:hypothetical protein
LVSGCRQALRQRLPLASESLMPKGCSTGRALPPFGQNHIPP